MKKVTLSVFALSLAFLVTGCGDSPDSLMKDMIKWSNDLADTLEKIKSKEDAEKYKGDLQKIVGRLKDFEERAKKLKMEDLPKDKKEALEKKYKDEGEKAGKRMQEAMNKLPKEAGPVLGDAFKDMGKQGGGGLEGIFGK